MNEDRDRDSIEDTRRKRRTRAIEDCMEIKKTAGWSLQEEEGSDEIRWKEEAIRIAACRNSTRRRTRERINRQKNRWTSDTTSLSILLPSTIEEPTYHRSTMKPSLHEGLKNGLAFEQPWSDENDEDCQEEEDQRLHRAGRRPFYT